MPERGECGGRRLGTGLRRVVHGRFRTELPRAGRVVKSANYWHDGFGTSGLAPSVFGELNFPTRQTDRLTDQLFGWLYPQDTPGPADLSGSGARRAAVIRDLDVQRIGRPIELFTLVTDCSLDPANLRRHSFTIISVSLAFGCSMRPTSP